MKNTDRVFELIKLWVKPIITLLAISLIYIIALYSIDAQMTFDFAFWVRTVIGWVLMAVMIALWLPEGKEYGKRNETFKANKSELNRRVDIVSKPNNAQMFEKFCDYANAENYNTKLRNEFARNRLNYDVYLQRQDDKEWLDKLDKKQRKFLSTVWKIKKPHQIKPTEVTSNSVVEYKFDTENKENKEQMQSVFIKLVISFVSSFVGFSIVITEKPFTAEAVAMAVYWTVMILTTVFFAIYKGYQLIVVTRMDYIRRMIDFFNHFDGWLISQGKTAVINVETK